jgi:site-specific recombinase XerD
MKHSQSDLKENHETFCGLYMSKYVRLFFNRKKKATTTVAGAIEIVVCLQRERCYFHSGHNVTLDQWENGMVVNQPRAVVINEEIQKKVTEFEHILIAMQVNKDDMTIAQFKTYLSADGGNRRNFMAWFRERINNRPLREGTRKGHLTTYKALERFGKFKTFDDVTLQHIYQFDLFIREEQTCTMKGKPIIRSQAAIHNYHKRFKSYVAEAFRLGLIKENPYERFQDKRGEKSDRPHLTEVQLKKLIRMREESTDAVMNRYLDFFLFQTFTGMAYSDAKSFDYEQHIVSIDGKEYIDGHRIKTGNEFVTPVLPITQKILERNNYKMEITSNQKYNQFLKGIGLALNCSFPLTTHIARHTFACTVALGQGISKEVLQFMMGHTSIKTTEIYAKLPMQYVSQNIGDKMFRAWK